MLSTWQRPLSVIPIQIIHMHLVSVNGAWIFPMLRTVACNVGTFCWGVLVLLLHTVVRQHGKFLCTSRYRHRSVIEVVQYTIFDDDVKVWSSQESSSSIHPYRYRYLYRFSTRYQYSLELYKYPYSRMKRIRPGAPFVRREY